MRQKRSRHRLGTRGPQLLTRLAAVAGCAAVLHPSDVSAKAGSPVPPAGPALDTEPPWVRADGFSPPRPFARTRAATPRPHPAIHPTTEAGPSAPLFPRAADVLDKKAERRAAMERHPAGKGLPRVASTRDGSVAAKPQATRNAGAALVDKSPNPGPCGKKHRVRPGETLWGIASRWSQTEAPIEILRLTLEIYRMNRDVIGPDPDLILPGQLLTLPERCER